MNIASPAQSELAIQPAGIPMETATGKRSAVDETRLALEAVQRIGDDLNALAFLNKKQALKMAQDVDRMAKEYGPSILTRKPLLGLPISVKEGLKVRGAPWTMGSGLNRGRIASEDGTVVRRLRQAGAIIVGLGSMAEMALWPETENVLTGRACNPLDLKRTPGGSSGGDAALVASGAVPAAIGADGGGSVRIPAACCGLWAHKPSAGLVPLTGHFPMDRGPDAEGAALAQFFTPGPMSHDVSLLWPLLEVMMGPDQQQPNIQLPLVNVYPDMEHVAGRDVWVLAEPRIRMASRVDQAQAHAIHTAGKILHQHGARLRQAPDDLLIDAFNIWMGTLMAAEYVDMERLIGCGRRVSLLAEIIGSFLGKRRHSLPALALSVSSRLDPRKASYWSRWAQCAQALSGRIKTMLKDGGLLLCPTLPGPAPFHGRSLFRPFDIAYCSVFNALGLPVTAVPVGKGPEGLPRSAQIIAAHRHDWLTISAALSISSQTQLK